MAITSSQNDVIVCDIVATVHTVCHTVTTAFTPVCYDAEAGATLRSNKAHFPPYFSPFLSFLFSLARSTSLHLSLDVVFSTDSFSSSTRHSPRSSSASIATTTATGPRHGLSLSVSTDELYRSTSF